MTRAAIKNAEERLREAILTNDAAALDSLLGEHGIYVRPDGRVLLKEDEVRRHRPGAQKITRYDPSEMKIVLHGDDVSGRRSHRADG